MAKVEVITKVKVDGVVIGKAKTKGNVTDAGGARNLTNDVHRNLDEMSRAIVANRF